MALEGIKNLAVLEREKAERLRQRDEAALAADIAGQKEREATSPAVALEEMIHAGGPRTSVEPALLQDAETHRFLDANARERLQRRASALKTPGPSVAERASRMEAPLGRFASEPDEIRQAELQTNPRGRMADAERVLEELRGAGGGGVSRETSLFTDAPRAQPRDDTGTMPYTGALGGLQGAEVPRAGIRQEFGGTAPDETLSFSDAQGRGPGMRPYNARSGASRDVGAPGGGLSTVTGGGGTGRVRDAQTKAMEAIRAEAKAAPLTPQETAGALLREEPLWDIQASELGPMGVLPALTKAVADGSLDPKIAQSLQRRYASIADDVAEKNGYVDPALFSERLQQGRPPAPGEAEARARTGGQAVPQAAEAERTAVQAATESVPGGPGERQSPALVAETEPAGTGGQDPRDALLGGIFGRPQRQSMTVPGVGGEAGYEIGGPFVPERMQAIPAAFAEARAGAERAAPVPRGESQPVDPRLAALPEEIRLFLEGLQSAAGGHEAGAERQRRLAREARRRPEG